MKSWKVKITTVLAALGLMISWFALANGMIDSKINAKFDTPMELIRQIYKRVERIEYKIDQIREKDYK